MNSSENYLGLSFLSFVIGFRELSDEGWEVIKASPPPRAGVGRPRINDRLIINGILYVLALHPLIRFWIEPVWSPTPLPTPIPPVDGYVDPYTPPPKIRPHIPRIICRVSGNLAGPGSRPPMKREVKMVTLIHTISVLPVAFESS